MSVQLSNRLVKRGSAVLAAGLFFGIVPGVVANADAAALPKATVTVKTSDNNVGTQGAYKIYNVNQQIDFSVSVSPNKAGQNYTYKIDRLVTGSWFQFTTDSFPLGPDSKAGFLYTPNSFQPGGSYRVQISYKGDKVSAANTSNIQYFKFEGKETDLKSVKIAYALPGKPSATGVRTYKKNVGYVTTTTVTRNATFPNPNKANFYVSKYNPTTKKYVASAPVAVAMTVSKTNAKIATAKFTFKRATVGTYHVRSDYLGDASNSRAGSPTYTIVVK